MDNADLYSKSNSLQRRDTIACLDENLNKIKWKKSGNRVIDLGCADGSVTDILRVRMPYDYDRLVGCDISENMVKYANEHYGSSRTSFRVFDVEGELTGDLRRGFDHVFSFYTFHWIQNQQRAFQNVYDLLDNNGDCLLLFLGHNPIFDVYRTLSRTEKWRSRLSHVERFISPYHDVTDPESHIKDMMLKIGFSDIEVKCQSKLFVFDNLEILKRSVAAVNPFNIAQDSLQDFLDDYVDVVRDMGLIENNNNEGKSNTIRCSYTVINVIAGKIISELNSKDSKIQNL